MPVNFLFYQGFISFLERKSVVVKRMSGMRYARKYKSFDFGQNTHEQIMHAICLL